MNIKTDRPASSGLEELRRPHITVENGHVYISQEITPQRRDVTAVKLSISKACLVDALKARLAHCMGHLQLAWNNQEVIDVQAGLQFTIIRFIDGSVFNSKSYQAMEEALIMLEELPDELTAEHLQLFSVLQLNQMKKALVNHFEFWTTSVSYIEEVEMFKMQNVKFC